jgi:hypothetical protein
MKTKKQAATVKYVCVKPVHVQVPAIVQHVIAEVPAIAKNQSPPFGEGFE